MLAFQGPNQYYMRHFFMAIVAQLVERRIVVPVVAGSSPVIRPIALPR